MPGMITAPVAAMNQATATQRSSATGPRFTGARIRAGGTSAKAQSRIITTISEKRLASASPTRPPA